MRKILGIFLTVLLVSGCSGKDAEIQRAVDLRMRLLSADCSFDADITADYGTEVHCFSVACLADADGNLSFTVTKPETIAGITGLIREDGGQLTFDSTAVTFPLLAEDQISPVSAPWIFLRTLRGGYLTAAGMEGDLLRLTIDDSYEEDSLKLDIWLNSSDQPIQADILYDGKRILTLSVSNFQIQ